jgi:hypothetical protein
MFVKILPVCDDFAPDTFAPDIEFRQVCTSCYWHGADHVVKESSDVF